MVKIPEQPQSYRPGDVVNGHVLTDHGHWVPVAGGHPAEGAQLPRVQAQPSTAGPVPRPAPAPADSGWRVREKKRRRFGPAQAVTLCGFIALAAYVLSTFGPADEAASTRAPSLTAAEIAAVTIDDLEVWHGADGARFVLYVSAHELERELVGVSATVNGYSADGATLLATGTSWVYLAGGHRALTIGQLTPVEGADPDARVETFNARLEVSETMRANPRLLVEDKTVDDGVSPITARVTITAAPLASTAAAVHVVVRDEWDRLIAVGTRTVTGVAAAEPVTVEVPLPELDSLPPDHTVEAFAAAI